MQDLNFIMRIIAIGDIHGNNVRFRKALKSISLKKTDKLVLIGDLVDRGKESKEVLDTLFLLQENGFENIIYIRGNHEQLLLDSFENESKEYLWIKNGGDKTLQSFKVNFCNEIPFKYIQLLKSSILYYEFEDYIFVHAGLNLSIEDPFKDEYSLLWTREMNEKDLINSKFAKKNVIHGHTPISQKQILDNLQNSKIINIDNGVYFEKENFGSLAVLDLTNKRINFIK